MDIFCLIPQFFGVMGKQSTDRIPHGDFASLAVISSPPVNIQNTNKHHGNPWDHAPEMVEFPQLWWVF